MIRDGLWGATLALALLASGPAWADCFSPGCINPTLLHAPTLTAWADKTMLQRWLAGDLPPCPTNGLPDNCVVGVNTNTCAGPPGSCDDPNLQITNVTQPRMSEIFDAMAKAAMEPHTVCTWGFCNPKQNYEQAAMYRAIAEVYRRHGQ